MTKYAGSIDIGGTKTLVGIVDERGNSVIKKYALTCVENYESHFDTCKALLDKCMEESGLSFDKLSGVGINVPGMADSEKGLLIQAPFAGWQNVDVKSYFEKRLYNLPVYIENDVNSCALGEICFGYGDRIKNFLWITISTGIGGAVVADGRLVKGSNFCAGEIGHIKVEYDLPKVCGCGQKGCLEAHASGTAITRRINELIMRQPQYKSVFEQRQLPCDAAGGAVLAREGDQDMLSIFQSCGRYIGIALSHAVNLLNPEAVFFGGGVARSLDLILPSIQYEISRDAVRQTQNVKLMESKLGYDAAMIGAAALVFGR